jgi:glycosyltransferase involved in cell wall biosynthesis
MRADPKFSILVPTFNRAGLLKLVIDSIFAQTYPAHEIIIMDDGSTDGTDAMIERYRKQNPRAKTPIRYLYQKNQGQSVALNNGISHATGDWLAFGADDDMFHPEKLERQARAIESHHPDCGACFSDAQYVYDSQFSKRAFQVRGRIEKKLKHPADETGVLDDPLPILIDHPHGIEVQTLIAKTELVRRIGGMDPRLRLNEDFDLLFRLSFVTKFCFVNQPLTIIDRNIRRTDGLTELITKRRKYALDQFEILYRKWLAGGFPLRESIRRQIIMKLQGVKSEMANLHLIEGKVSEACRDLSDANAFRLNAKLMTKHALIKLAPTLVKRLTVANDDRMPI